MDHGVLLLLLLLHLLQVYLGVRFILETRLILGTWLLLKHLS